MTTCFNVAWRTRKEKERETERVWVGRGIVSEKGVWYNVWIVLSANETGTHERHI